MSDIDKLAQSGKDMREKTKNAKASFEQKKKRKEEKITVLNTSRLHFIFGYRYFPFVLMLVALFFSTLFFLSDIFGFHLHGKGGGRMYYPEKDHYGTPLFIWVVCFWIVIILIQQLIIPYVAQRTFEKEKQFIAQLPFKTENYFETLGKQIGSVDFEISWKNNPDPVYIEDIIRGMKLNKKITYGRFISDDYKLSIDLGSSSYKNGYRAMKMYHLFCEKMFLPLQQKHGIIKIVVS